MFPEPRVIAIDNESEHLESLIEAFMGNGWYCYPIHFSHEIISEVPKCRHARVIFVDLNLVSGASISNLHQNFNTIAHLIERIKPVGPYLIFLWSRYSDKADELYNYLDERLKDVPKPIIIKHFDKEIFLKKGKLENSNELTNAVKEIFKKQPELSALLEWERKVSDAAGETVASVLNLADGQENWNSVVATMLAKLAVGAVGKDHVTNGKCRAVNDALLPILADRIASLRSKQDSDIWKSAFKETDSSNTLNPDQIAELNRFLHIDLSSESGNCAWEPGIVIELPQEISEQFETKFGLTMENAASSQFHCKKTSTTNSKFQWVLVNARAVCDYSQMQPGPMPLYLGLLLPEGNENKNTPKAAIWKTPCFRFKDKNYRLYVNSRFQVSLTENTVQKLSPIFIFRLREQLLNCLIHDIHSHSARPGIIEIRKN